MHKLALCCIVKHFIDGKETTNETKIDSVSSSCIGWYLTITNIGVIPAAAEEEGANEPIIFQKEDFESLEITATEEVIVGAIGKNQAEMSIGLGAETSNQYVTLSGGKANGNFFITRDGLIALNATGNEPAIESGKILWIAMNVRLGTSNYDRLIFRTRADGTLDKKTFFELHAGDIYKDNANQTECVISSSEWTTIVCEINLMLYHKS